ncbi:MAG: hypothetical protein K5839_08080 [Treponemataceae bacterium]|nr:hypothetical protein [Treponemataceae bacterium]
MKRFLSVLAILALVGSFAFAQEAEGNVSFSNTVKTDVVGVNADGAAFNYVYDEMEALYLSEKVDIYAKGRIQLMTPTSDEAAAAALVGKEIAGVPVAFGYVPDETYFGINFKPVKGLALGIGQSIVIPGAYLAVEDDDLEYGKLACPGFDIAYTGVSGLTLVAAFDFMSGVYNNYFVDANGNYVFNTRCGGFYEYSKEDSDFAFTVGAAFRYNNGSAEGISCVTPTTKVESNPYHAGAYVTVTPIADLTFYAGYSYNVDDDLYITGDHVVNFSAAYSYEDMACAADFQTNTDGEMYAGVYFGYTIKGFTPEVACQFTTTYADFAEGWFGVFPDVAWEINDNHKVVCGAAIEFNNGAWDCISFPCKWVYSF